MFIAKSMFAPCINITTIATSTGCLKLDVLMSIMIAFGEAFITENGVIALSAVEAAVCCLYLCLVDTLGTDRTDRKSCYFILPWKEKTLIEFVLVQSILFLE